MNILNKIREFAKKISGKKYKKETPKNNGVSEFVFFENRKPSGLKTKAKTLALSVLMLLGATKTANFTTQHKDDIKKHIELKSESNKEDIIDEIKHDKYQTYSSFLESDIVQKSIPWLLSVLNPTEGFRSQPYQCTEGVWSIGFGNTFLPSGKRVTKNTPPITIEEGYDLAVWHMKQETMFYLYCYYVGAGLEIRDIGEAVSLGSLFYNMGSKFVENKKDPNHRKRMALLRKEYKKYGYEIPADVVKDAFEKYPITNPTSFGKAWLAGNWEQMINAIGNFMGGGPGIPWRRWIEAMIMKNGVDFLKNLLKCPKGGLWEFYVLYGGKDIGKYALWDRAEDGRLIPKDLTEEFYAWLDNPVKLGKNGKLVSIKRRKKIADGMLCSLLQTLDENHNIVDDVLPFLQDKSLANNVKKKKNTKSQKTEKVLAKKTQKTDTKDNKKSKTKKELAQTKPSKKTDTDKSKKTTKKNTNAKTKQVKKTKDGLSQKTEKVLAKKTNVTKSPKRKTSSGKKTSSQQPRQSNTYTLSYIDYYRTAVSSYKSGDYETALLILNTLVSQNPNKASLHNDIAVVYNKMGVFDKTIEHTNIVLHQIRDKSQYGAAHYNAGKAYEKKGDLHKSLANYKLALSNGNKSATNAINRINQKLMKDNKSNKRTAFNKGVENIKRKYEYKPRHTHNRHYQA